MEAAVLHIGAAAEGRMEAAVENSRGSFCRLVPEYRIKNEPRKEQEDMKWTFY